ncbi:oligosaccharide flippase family protein [Vagococcus sp. DIV0080]|uniref:Oligosaccharide flippase family protein n=1 Tax=Candidatus Vagococcus giribetii TaxID=2230876 RepID=A0ABS3HU80_9ENTE|nr:oligosaccharide flippase family protein [Vagococcus sp. DIV0080]MBO0477314.1 oligosaccharide flippase family protein [Vagococcus sp. DIV0080]
MARSVRFNAFIRTIMNLVNILIPLLAGPYLARVLDVNLYAEYNRALAIVAWFLPFATLGVYNYGIREISRVKKDKKKVNFLFSELFYISVICTILVTLLYLLTIKFTISSEVKIIYYIFSIQIISQMFFVEWMNEANENYMFIFLKTTIIKILQLVSIFLFVKSKDDIVIFAIITTLSIFFNYLISYISIRKSVELVLVPWSSIVKRLKPLLVMLLLMNANMLYTYLDRLFLSFTTTNTIEISYYQFSLSIVSLITQVINSIIIVSIPRLSKYLTSGKNKEYLTLLDKTAHLFLCLGIPLCLGMAIMSKDIIYMYSGSSYLAAAPTLALFSLRTLLWLGDRIFAGQLLFIHGYENELTKIYLKYGMLNLLFNIILLVLGNSSASLFIITTMIAELFLLIDEILLSKRKGIEYNIIFDHKTVEYVFSGVIMVLSVYYIRNKYINVLELSFEYFFRVLCVVCFGVLIYFLSIYLQRKIKTVF